MSSPYAQGPYGDQAYPEVAPAYSQDPYVQSPYANQTPYTPQQNAGYVSSPNYQQAEASYNPYSVNYQSISVEQWQDIPCQQSEYSQYWSSPQSFEPEEFSKNTKEQTKCNDMFWAILFWINFLATVAVFVYLCVKNVEELDIGSPFGDMKYFKQICGSIGVGAATGLVLNILHFLYAAFAPSFYIKFGMILMLIISIIVAIFGFFTAGSPLFFIFPVFSIIITILFYCSSRAFIPMSVAIFEEASTIMRKHPSIILFIFVQIFIEMAVSLMFCLIVYLVQFHKWSNFFYIYLAISYLYIDLTFKYVCYLTIAGLGATWYFLKGENEEYFPKHPVWESFKRACTTSFGSASAAGLLLAIVQFLKIIVNSNIMCDSDNGWLSCLFMCLRCCAMCILNILDCFVQYMNRYALIYCATFGIPYIGACKRWAELECTRFVGLLMNTCIISNCLSYNFILFSIAGALVGFGFGYLIYDEFEIRVIYCCIFALFFTFGFFSLFEQPLMTLSDTLMVCFCESPKQLKTTANSLYEKLTENYSNYLGMQLGKQGFVD